MEAAQAIEQQAESFRNVTYTHPDEDGKAVTGPRVAPVLPARGASRVGRNDDPALRQR